MSAEDDMKKVQEIANRYEAVFRGLPGVVSVYIVGGGREISLCAMNEEAARFIRALLADRIEGVPIKVGTPGYGALDPRKKH